MGPIPLRAHPNALMDPIPPHTDPYRSSLGEDLCSEGFSGPMCAVCVPEHYRTSTGWCRKCSEASERLVAPYIVPTATLLLLLLLCGWSLFQRTRAGAQLTAVSSEVPLLHHLTRLLQAKTKALLQGAVVGPKLKILVSMLQVQSGMVPAFSVLLPENFNNVLRTAQVWQIALPFECIYTSYNFYTTLLYQTLAPLAFTAALTPVWLGFAVSRVRHQAAVRRVLRWSRDFWFFVIYLIYPSVGSLIFSTFSCTDFDDGSRFLRADFSIDCRSESHARARVYACWMGILYVLGIPCIYGVSIWIYHQQLGAVDRVQKHLLASKEPSISIDESADLAPPKGLSARRGVEAAAWALYHLLSAPQRSAGGKSRGQVAAKLVVPRARATTLFKAWHPRLGLDLDPIDESAVVRDVWPVFFDGAALSEAEETAGYLRFLRARLALARRDAEARSLQAEIGEAMRGGLMKHSMRSDEVSSTPGAVAREAWDGMTVRQRRRWVPASGVDRPDRRWQLIFINGQRVPPAHRRGDSFDHSATYRMLEQARGGSPDVPQITPRPRMLQRLRASSMSLLAPTTASPPKKSKPTPPKPPKTTPKTTPKPPKAPAATPADATAATGKQQRLNALVALRLLWSGWIEFVAQSDPGLERPESNETFAELQRVSGAYLVTSSRWEAIDERLAALDHSSDDARLPAIRRAVDDFVRGTSQVSTIQAAIRAARRRGRGLQAPEGAHASAHQRAVRKLCLFIDQMEGSTASAWRAADAAWESVAATMATPADAAAKRTAAAAAAGGGQQRQTLTAMRAELDDIYAAEEAELARGLEQEAAESPGAADVARAALVRRGGIRTLRDPTEPRWCDRRWIRTARHISSLVVGSKPSGIPQSLVGAAGGIHEAGR